MLNVLLQAEAALPALLTDEAGLIGLYADSERPALRRLWRQLGEYRAYLHRFNPLYSLMVAGPVEWPENRVRGNAPARELFPGERADLFAFFRGRYA